jgi:hypothetical protein
MKIETVAPHLIELARKNLSKFNYGFHTIDEEIEQSTPEYLIAYAYREKVGISIPDCIVLLADYKRLYFKKMAVIPFQNSICIGNEIIKLENGIDTLRIRQKEEPDAPYLQNQIDNNKQRIKALQWVLNTCNFKSTLPD